MERSNELDRGLATLSGVEYPVNVPDRIKVASPCSAKWELMKGDDQVRFCAECHKHVYNLSAMTRRDAENLLREKDGRICTHYYRRQDSTILTEDCPAGLRVKAARLRRRAGVAFSGLLGFAATAFAQPPTAQKQLIQVEPDSKFTIAGTAKDQMGGVLPGAVATVRDSKSGREVRATSNAKGEFRVESLNSGSYTVTVSLIGFSTFKKEITSRAGDAKIEAVLLLGTTGGPMVPVEPVLSVLPDRLK
jgi:hypothetical protein